MSDFLYRFRDYIALVFCVLISALLLNTNDSPQIDKIRVKSAVIGGVLSRPFQFIPETIRLYSVNRQLNRGLFELTIENAKLRELQEENKRLREMLNFVSVNKLHYLPAEVVNKNEVVSLNCITLDRGLRDGVKRGYPVISSKGLVGMVSAVTKKSSICQLMLDNQFGAAVRDQRSRIDGILHWDAGDDCRLDGIAPTMDIQPGDTIITSGIGGVYPEGIYVGVVSKIRKQAQGSLFQNILVEPFTEFYRLEEVFIILPDSAMKADSTAIKTAAKKRGKK